jgi:YD repeat-containing protein
MILMRKILLILACIIITQRLFAQDDYAPNTIENASNSLNSPSAGNSFLNNSNISKSQADVGVDLYTGTATVNVPICNLEAKEMNIPISLSYVGGRGIHVQDVANDVGLGWQLNAGGYIKRMIRGSLPDEASFSVQGYLRNPTAPSIGNQDYDLGLDDAASDVYYVTTPFTSFHFTFDNQGKPLLPEDNNGYKIIYTLPPDNSNTQRPNPYNSTPLSFEIIDNGGNQYYFNTQDLVTTGLPATAYEVTPQICVYADTWYLDKIVTYNSKETIQFNYTTGTNYTVNKYIGKTIVPYNINQLYNGVPFAPSGSAQPIAIPTTYYNVQYLSSITTSLGEVDFTYANDREDFPGAERLANISLKALNPYPQSTANLLRTYNFNYDYFGTPSTDPNQLRLRLDNITLTGTDANTSQPLTLNSFDYNTDVNLPSRNSAQFDYWGYYNYYNSGTLNTWYLLPEGYLNAPNRAPKEISTEANILTNIHNLSGESEAIVYEQNIWHPSNGGVTTANTIPVGGLRVSRILHRLPDGFDLTTQYNYNDINGTSTGQVYGYMNGPIDPNNPSAYGTVGGYYPEYSSGGSGVFYNALSYYNLVNHNHDNTSGTSNPATWQVCTLSETPYNTYDLNGNFIGYSSVTVTDPNGGYTVNKFTNFSDFSDILNYSMIPFNYLGRYSYIINAADNVYGETVAFTDPTTTSPYINNSIPQIPTSYTTIDNSEKRGLLLNKSAYTASGNKVSETNNTYTLVNTNPPTTNGGGYTPINWGLANISYVDDDDGNYPGINSSTDPNYTYSAYNFSPQSYRLTETVNTDYDQNNPGNGIQKITDYTYSPANYRSIRTLTTTDSKGKQHVQTFLHADDYYPTDYTGGLAPLPASELTAITNMLQGNNCPLIHTIDQKNGTTLHQEHESYSQTVIDLGWSPSGDVYSYKNYLTGLSLYTGSTLEKQQSFIYDINASNLNSKTDLGGREVATLYGYQSSYPIAQVINANPTECYYESFEESPYGVPASNLIIPGDYSLPAHTGNMFLPYASWTVPFIKPNNRNYIIQWWNWANGKWNFNQETYTNNMVLNNGSFDDVRIFPSDAQMVSYTYNPQVGKTSSISIDGKTTTYEYDGLGRLRLTRDQDRNIIKRYCYTYAQQIESCTTDPTTIFAQLSYQNIVNTGNEITADAVVSFYSDAACTQPVFVNNLTVNYETYTSCDDDNIPMGQTSMSTGAGGTNFTLMKQLIIYNVFDDEENQDCFDPVVLLLPGNYTIQN